MHLSVSTVDRRKHLPPFTCATLPGPPPPSCPLFAAVASAVGAAYGTDCLTPPVSLVLIGVFLAVFFFHIFWELSYRPSRRLDSFSPPSSMILLWYCLMDASGHSSIVCDHPHHVRLSFAHHPPLRLAGFVALRRTNGKSWLPSATDPHILLDGNLHFFTTKLTITLFIGLSCILPSLQRKEGLLTSSMLLE